MFESVKVAAISMKPKPWDRDGNADRLEQFFTRAAAEGVRLAVAPEGVLEGYVVNEAIENPALAERVRTVAEPIDGPYIRRFQALARRLDMCVCFGFAELIDRDVYNCAVVIGNDGQICGKYHKTQFAEGYHETWWFNRIGKTLRAIDTPIGRVGIVICNDRWNPQIARTLVLDGARAILIPSFGSRNRAQNLAVMARARENGVPVVEANVGLNVIISQGELVAYKFGFNNLTTATIEIPLPPSTEAARRSEAEYLAAQGPEMARRYVATLAKLAEPTPKKNGKVAVPITAVSAPEPVKT